MLIECNDIDSYFEVYSILYVSEVSMRVFLDPTPSTQISLIGLKLFIEEGEADLGSMCLKNS